MSSALRLVVVGCVVAYSFVAVSGFDSQEVSNRRISSTQFLEDYRNANECNILSTGKNCHKRTCPFGLSMQTSTHLHGLDAGRAPGLVDPVSKETTAGHTVQECSGSGTCDRFTGECICFKGFNGAACNVIGCPNNCNSKGYCAPMTAVNEKSSRSTDAFASAEWARSKIYQCVCDHGYFGGDCSQRFCPLGVDPAYNCEEGMYDDIQEIDLDDLHKQITIDSKTYDAPRTFTLGFAPVQSPASEMYITSPIELIENAGTSNFPCKSSSQPEAKCNRAQADLIQQALELLPNSVLESVQVRSTKHATNKNTFNLIFSDSFTPGKQHLVSCNPQLPEGITPCANGVVPKLDSDNMNGLKIGIGCPVRRVGTPETVPGTSYRPGTICSNRGICNSQSGQCKCIEGAAGRACDKFSIA